MEKAEGGTGSVVEFQGFFTTTPGSFAADFCQVGISLDILHHNDNGDQTGQIQEPRQRSSS